MTTPFTGPNTSCIQSWKKTTEMAIERSLPSKTLEELLDSLQINPTGTQPTAPPAEVSEVGILPEAGGDAAAIEIVDL